MRPMEAFDFLDFITEGQEIRLWESCEDGRKILYEGSDSPLREIKGLLEYQVAFISVSDDGVLEIEIEEV